MTCQERQDLWELYGLGLLDAAEQRDLEQHLASGCALCRGNYQRAMGLNAMFLANAPDLVPPARLRRRILASVGVDRSAWAWLVTAAAACGLLIAVWFTVQQRNQAIEAQRQLAEARTQIQASTADRDRVVRALNFLNQPETRQVNFGAGQPQPPRGKIFVNDRMGVLLIASNLPAIAPGQTYEMWVIPKGGAPQPAGLFAAGADRTALHVFDGPFDPASLAAVAVSVEPAQGSSAPTTTPFIVAPVPGA